MLKSKRHSCSPITIQVQNQDFFSLRRTPHVAVNGGGGRGNSQYPLVCLAFPAPDDRERKQQAEALRVRDHLTELLEEIGMPRTGNPLFEEDTENDTHVPEIGSSLPAIVDPYMVEESGHLYITTWGGLYEKPSTLWEQRGGCVAAQVRAVVAFSGDLFFSTREVQR